ncbi:MAG TPA: DUF4118 domain-containing protein, partial [Kiloniellales bacterium]|nr:DUF4118 domain-containing protein [Kiloniellales bacterium]
MAVLALLLRLLLDDYLSKVVFITFFPSLFVVAVLTDWRAAALHLLLGVLLIWYFVLPPAQSFAFERDTPATLLAFLAAGGFVIGLTAMLDTQRRKYAAAAQRADLLYRELRHRVGNILQLCSSLLRLRAQDLEPSQQQIVTDAATQLTVIQRLHDRIAGSEEMVALEAPLRELCEAVMRFAPGFNCALNCEGVTLPRNHLIPVALIVHELLNNAVEHGVDGKGAGNVTVEAKPEPANSGWRLSVTDDGPGLPAGFS